MALATGALMLTAACTEDWLALEPRTQVLESNYYKTEDQAFEAVVATYDVLQWGGFGGYTPVEMISDIMSDDALCGGGSATDQPSLQVLETFTYTPTQHPDGMWAKFYSGINRANIVISRIDNVETWKNHSKEQILAEAHFLRVFYFYNLWRFYGNVPLVDHLLSPAEYNMAKTPADEIYAWMVKQLDDNVIGKLPVESAIPVKYKGRISNGAAIALKAKIVLYQNDMSKMGEIAQQLVSVIEPQTYELESSLSFVFSNAGEFCKESVLEVNHTEASDWGDWGWLAGGEGNIQVVMVGVDSYSGPGGYAPGWGFSPIEPSLYNSYAAGDLRRDATIFDLSTLEGTPYKARYQHTGYHNKKYAPLLGQTSGNNAMTNYNNNIRIIRYSDVLLMASEALLRSNGDLGKAQTYYNMVRDRAFGDTNHRITLTAGEAGLSLIFNERRLELALEGHRYWDVVRFGKAPELLGAKGWVETKKYWPIPQKEIDKTGGTLKQNTGY